MYDICTEHVIAHNSFNTIPSKLLFLKASIHFNRNMLPLLLVMAKQIPILGDVLSAIDGDGGGGGGKKPKYGGKNNKRYDPEF